MQSRSTRRVAISWFWSTSHWCAPSLCIYENLPMHVELEDLVHAGILGLFDAATKYDDTKQVLFRGYAKHRIKGAILDSLREMDWASRDLEEVTREFAVAMARQPMETEIAEKMGMDLERWRQRFPIQR
jgi:RNA polymerase sigma factor FliA